LSINFEQVILVCFRTVVLLARSSAPGNLSHSTRLGNGLSIVILVGMLAVAVVSALKFPVLETTSLQGRLRLVQASRVTNDMIAQTGR
jgi:hypothetical protein